MFFGLVFVFVTLMVLFVLVVLVVAVALATFFSAPDRQIDGIFIYFRVFVQTLGRQNAVNTAVFWRRGRPKPRILPKARKHCKLQSFGSDLRVPRWGEEGGAGGVLK